MGFLELDYCEAEMSHSNFMPTRSLQQNRFTTHMKHCVQQCMKRPMLHLLLELS
jgi:hypothetical protein